MRYLAITAAALMLLAVPATSFAQSDTSGGTGTSAGSGAGTGTGGNGDAGTGVNAGAGTGGNGDITTGTNNQVGGESQCSDETATSSYDSFSEKCRHQIDAWAASQSGKGAKFEGDIAVGTVIPDTVEIVEVPAYHNYGYVMLNDRRVLVDRTTHKVIRVY